MNPKVSKYIKSIQNKNIHVIGASGAEGAAIINFLYSHGIKNITAHDFQPDLPSFRKRFKQTNATLSPTQRAKILRNIINPNITLNLKNNYLNNLLDANLIFLTQAWYIYPPNFPLVQKAIDNKIPISSLTKLYFDLAPCPIIGITGSQGKSTTTALIMKIIKSAKKKVHTGGNLRDMSDQLLNQIDKINKSDFIVLELSNRQLTIDHQSSPHIAVITNITPNHIEEHGSYQKYINTKKSILKYQKSKDISILNFDNLLTRKMINHLPTKIIPFSVNKIIPKGIYLKNNFIYYQKRKIVSLEDINIAGQHNLSNILAAAATASSLKINPSIISKTIKQFKGIPHRLQPITKINGITFIDDLKSSTPTSTIAAINSFPNQNIHLIIGGNHKNVSYQELAKSIDRYVTTLFCLPGTATNEIIKELSIIESKVKIFQFKNIFKLISKIKTITQPGDIVLLSPAGANFQETHLKNKYSLKSLLTQIQ